MGRAITIALAMTAYCAQASAQEDPVRVAVGELRSEPGDAAAFSRAMSDALGAHQSIELTSVRSADLVVRGSIVRWERHDVGGALEVRCEVSLIVSDAGGSIRAMLRGRGGARGSGGRLSEDALRAAVRGALRPLAEQGPALARAS